jgi:hypothetical protein
MSDRTDARYDEKYMALRSAEAHQLARAEAAIERLRAEIERLRAEVAHYRQLEDVFERIDGKYQAARDEVERLRAALLDQPESPPRPKTLTP